MDYRDLLKKYIKHVGEIEGVDYLGEYDKLDIFTDDEWSEVRKLSDEVYAEFCREIEREK